MSTTNDGRPETDPAIGIDARPLGNPMPLSARVTRR
jgi:hypothetical protein